MTTNFAPQALAFCFAFCRANGKLRVTLKKLVGARWVTLKQLRVTLKTIRVTLKKLRVARKNSGHTFGVTLDFGKIKGHTKKWG